MAQKKKSFKFMNLCLLEEIVSLPKAAKNNIKCPKNVWAQSGAATAGEGVEDITLIIMTHPMSFPCLSIPNRFLQ